MGYGRTAEEIKAEGDESRAMFRFWIKVGAGCIALLVGVVFLSGLVMPPLRLYKQNTEKRAVIAEQKAKSEAAEYAARSQVTQAQAKADAEVIRAKGLAESQDIIASTLTEEYLRYLYIDALAGGDGQIIYVPTEAGLPILEAGRGVEAPKEGE